MAFTQVALTGIVELSPGTPANGAVVTALLSAPITDSQTVIAPEPVSATCGTDGSFSVTVPANDDPSTNPKGTSYQVQITYGAQILDELTVVVPHADAPTVNLFTLVAPSGSPAQTSVMQLTAGTGIVLSPAGGTGVVEVSSTGGGGGTLAGDTDVSITSPANNQGLVYNSTAAKWENTAVANSFNGRTGAVVPTTGDYTAAQVTGAGVTVQGASGTNLGAAQTINFASTQQEIWLAGTLNANLTVTLSNRVAGCRALLLLTQDATGGRTLTVTDGSNPQTVTITSTAAALSVVEVKCPDATAIDAVAAGGGGGGGGPAFTSTLPAFDTTTPTAGSAATVVHSDHAHPRSFWTAEDHGLLSWSFDPSLAGANSAAITAGQLYVVRMHLPVPVTIANVWLGVGSAGVGLTAGEAFAGVYTAAGALIGSTADQSSNWTTISNPPMPLTAQSAGSLTGVSGDVYAAFYVGGGTTMPKFLCGATVMGASINLPAAAPRYGRANTGLTTALPTTLGVMSSYAWSFWAALS